MISINEVTEKDRGRTVTFFDHKNSIYRRGALLYKTHGGRLVIQLYPLRILNQPKNHLEVIDIDPSIASWER
jgi:hypothetical protein